MPINKLMPLPVLGEVLPKSTPITDKIKIAILKNAAILEKSRIANSADKDFILREPKN